MIGRRPIDIAALATAVALGGCWVPIERGRQLEARIQRLEVQSVEQERTLEEQRASLRERVARADEELRAVQAKIDELNRVARKSGANLAVELGKLQEDFARVKGDLEAALHRLGEAEKRLRDVEASTEGKFAALRGAGALDEHEARQKIAALGRSDDRESVLALAQQEDREGRKGVAREVYEEYARRWPSDPRTAEARFRSGEIAFDQRRWRDALLAFGRVAEDFPRADVAPDAMLGAAEAMLKLEMKDEAKAVLEQLVGKYPKTKAATRARQRLAELAPPASARKKTPKKK